MLQHDINTMQYSNKKPGVFLIGMSGSGKTTIISYYLEMFSVKKKNLNGIWAIDLDTIGLWNPKREWIVDLSIINMADNISNDFPVLISGIGHRLKEIVEGFLEIHFTVLALPVIELTEYRDRIMKDKLRKDRHERSVDQLLKHIEWYESILDQFSEIQIIPNELEKSIAEINSFLITSSPSAKLHQRSKNEKERI